MSSRCCSCSGSWLDVGALVWFANPGPAEKVRENKVYRRLSVRTEGRDVFLPEDGELYEATSFISVLSIPLLVDELVPPAELPGRARAFAAELLALPPVAMNTTRLNVKAGLLAALAAGDESDHATDSKA